MQSLAADWLWRRSYFGCLHFRAEPHIQHQGGRIVVAELAFCLAEAAAAAARVSRKLGMLAEVGNWCWKGRCQSLLQWAVLRMEQHRLDWSQGESVGSRRAHDGAHCISLLARELAPRTDRAFPEPE